MSFKKFSFTWVVCCTLLLLCACNTQERVVYLQDLEPKVTLHLQEAQSLTLKSGDRLSVLVHSRDDELAQMFNLNRRNGSNVTTGNNNNNSYYTVDETGCIDFPILGLIPVAGLTRLQVADAIKYKLLAGKLLRDPIVIVEYARLGFEVLGEVKSPGRKEIDRDCITLLDALAECGDLTIQGRRDNVLVMRTEDGKLTPYRVDLTSMQSLFASPAYYIQQNDVIYVEPNSMKTNQSEQNATLVRTPTFWISVTNFLMTLCVFLAK